MENRIKNIISLVSCPQCRGSLVFTEKQLLCEACDCIYPLSNGIPDLTISSDGDPRDAFEQADQKFQQDEMYQKSMTAKIINSLKQTVTCEYTPFRQLSKFLEQIPEEAVFVEMGSGNRRLLESSITIDLFPFPNVDILSNIQKMPFQDKTVDYVVIDAVLEHVSAPQMVVDELFRILKPGGKVFITVPFIHQYHGYPNNFFHISSDGIRHLFKNFDECVIEMYRGPTTALINLLAEYVAICFSRGEKNFVYTCVRGIFLMPIFPLKYLDRLWSPKGGALRIAHSICAYVTK